MKNYVPHAADESILVIVETDAFDYAISATLNQDGRPVAFFYRTLEPNEQHHSPVEKEAYAIVESIRYWIYFLQGRHLKPITDPTDIYSLHV